MADKPTNTAEKPSPQRDREESQYYSMLEVNRTLQEKAQTEGFARELEKKLRASEEENSSLVSRSQDLEKLKAEFESDLASEMKLAQDQQLIISELEQQVQAKSEIIGNFEKLLKQHVQLMNSLEKTLNSYRSETESRTSIAQKNDLIEEF